MQHSNNQLYSGPLSEAAQKVLVALRDQSLSATRYKCLFSYNCNRMERNGSQGEPWIQSTSISQSEMGDSISDRSQVSFYCASPHKPFNHRQNFQTLAYYQYPQTQDSSLTSFSSSYWDSSLQRQTCETECYYQCSHMYSHRQYSESPIHQFSKALPFSEREVSQTTASFSLGDQQALSVPIPKRAWDEATFSTMSTNKNPLLSDNSSPDIKDLNEVHIMKKTWQMSDSELHKKDGAGRVEMGTDLPTEKREIKSVSYLGITEDTNLVSSSYFVTARMDKSSDCRDVGKKLSEKEIDECSLSACDAELLSDSDKVLSGNNSRRLFKILPSVLGECHRDQKGGRLMQCEAATVNLADTGPNNFERTKEGRIDRVVIGLKLDKENVKKEDIIIATENVIEAEQPHCAVLKTKNHCGYKKVIHVYRGDKGPREIRKDGDESVMAAVDSADKSASTEGSGRKGCLTLTAQGYRARESVIEAPCLHHNVQTAIGYIRGESSSKVASTFTSGQNPSSVLDSVTLKNSNLPTSHMDSQDSSLFPSFSQKRTLEELPDQNINHPRKICLLSHPPKWKPLLSSQEKILKGVYKCKMAIPKVFIAVHPSVLPETQNKASDALESERVGEVCTEPYVPMQMQQRKIHINYRAVKYARHPYKQTLHSVTKSCKRDKFGADKVTNKSMTYHEQNKIDEPQPQTTASCPAATVISDPRIMNFEKLDRDEKMQWLKEVGQAKTLVLTMVYEDGTTQLDPEKKSTPSASGLLILMKNDLDSCTPENLLRPKDSLVYLKLEQTPVRTQQHTQNQKLFTRDVLVQVISRSEQVVCYKAKDLLRTALQFYKKDFSWKQVGSFHIQDPQVTGWLLDPADPSSCYQDLLNKHYKRPLCKPPALSTNKASQVISGLATLYWLNKELRSKLQSQGLWKLYSNMEQYIIPVLAAMESHCIYVDKETLKRTSDLLGTKMKQLEQEAHHAAGEKFLITSNSQLRTILFEKLRLHELCENKKLPKTINKQQQSTSEATLLQLQDLHPLPKVILEYRQVHKIKSTFVDGILSCMMSKHYISSTWSQTNAVTGRISAKHPNFQALPRQPLQITKKQSIQGKEEGVVTVHPRAMFIPQEGWTFVAADFCQVELRLLAHLSSDPELLRIFTNPQADVFTMLASQWNGIEEDKVTSEDREHAKRIVYSIVYGAGCKRLPGILGVSSKQASKFKDSFLQTYREVQTFVQRTILQCHKQGYALSIMGRQRALPNINSPDWAIRMQAERQAVNFVVQGSAADLCKMAMIRIFNLVSSSSFLSARLIAQLHDELLYEVEDSQVEHFAALVKNTMESLQHIHQFDVHLKVPLKVALSSGKSWGSMSELNITSSSSTFCL